MTHDRRTLLRALGAGSIGLASVGSFGRRAAAATVTEVRGGGEDIWGTADAFHYYYAQVSGDFDVTVRSMGVEDTEAWAKGGLMVRGSLDPDSKNAMLRRRPNGEASVQWRSTDGGETQSVGGTDADWLRLTRSGDAVTAYRATEAGDWTEIETLTADEIGLGDEVYLGLAVTSHAPGVLCTARFARLEGVTPTASTDVGDVEVSGGVSTTEGVPLVSTRSPTALSGTSLRLAGELTDLGDADAAECRFEYRWVMDDEWTATDARTLTSPGEFTVDVDDLLPRRYYEIRAVAATADGDTARGSPVQFETPSVDHYQVDFVGGAPIEELGEDGLYADQNRLMRFAFGTPGEGITERDTAWPSADLRDCVDYGHIRERDDGTASVSFSVADDCEAVTLSLAVHSMPGDEFSTGTVDRQVLLDSTTGTYGPGEHTVTVDLPAPSGSRNPLEVVVDGSGDGDYETVQAAVDALPGTEREAVVHIRPGVYREKLTVPEGTTDVTFVGEDPEETVLTYDDNADTLDENGEPLGTYASASTIVNADRFGARGVTFRNASPPVAQAVAIRLDGDQCVFENCRFVGNQDTLYTHGHDDRQYFRDCYVEGDVDFVFGASTAWFESCEIFCTDEGYVTAAATPEEDDVGYVFDDCEVRGSAPDGSVYLGRPWGPYATVLFRNSYLGDVVAPEGWHPWDGREETCWVGEYRNRGPGKWGPERVSWAHHVDDDEADEFDLTDAFGDWDPTERLRD